MAGVAVAMKHWNRSEINMAVKHINSKKHGTAKLGYAVSDE